MYILGEFASPGKRKEVATYEDDGDLPGRSFSFSPKKKTSVQTQTTQSSFSTVTNSTLCRICGEGRRETKAMWVGCSHVRNLGRVNLTWVLGPCIMHRNNSYIQGPSAGLGGNAPSTLVHVEWKQTHKKKMKSLIFYSLLFTFFQFIYTSTDIKPLVVWKLTRYLHFCSSVLCLWNEITPFPLWLVTRHTVRFIVFKKLSKFVRTLITKKRFSISTYVYRHGKAK